MGRQSVFDKKQVLDNALELFWSRGYAAASLKQLEDVTDMHPGSLYYHFQSKECLYVAVLKHYIQCHLQPRIDRNLYKGPPGSGLRRFLTSGYRHPSELQFKSCCFLACTCTELHLLPQDASDLVQKGLNNIVKGLDRAIRKANLISDSPRQHEDAHHHDNKQVNELLNLYLSLQLMTRVDHNQHRLDQRVKDGLDIIFNVR